MAAGPICGRLASRTGKRAELARSFPTGHMIQVELHKFLGHRHGLLLVAKLEDRIAAYDFLGFHEWAIDDAELAVLDAHLRTGLDRHQPAIVEHAAGLDLPVGELVHGLHQFRRWVSRRAGMFDEIHEAHPKTPSWASRGTLPPNCLANRSTNRPGSDRHRLLKKNWTVIERSAESADSPVNYCRSMISGSAVSGTSRHCALSSAWKCQTSPFADINISSPRSSRHIVGLKASTAGSQRGLRNTWKLSAVASVLVRVRPQTGRPLPRTIDQSPIIWSIDLASERAAARFCRM